MDKNAKAVLERLNNSGYQAYLVGGCVRDSIMGREPHDWDICTDALPSQTKSVFSRHNISDMGLKFGTVVVTFDKKPYEITTYRIDQDYSDGRHPDDVQFSDSLVEDLSRRDFTINAIAQDSRGHIVDPFNGKKDIENKTIRCVGDPDKRFREDGLRILRALRFASRYSFEIEEKTSESIHKNAHLLKNISAERIQSELVQILSGEGAKDILMEYRDVIAVPIPELEKTFDYDQKNPHHCYDLWEHTVTSVSNIRNDPVLRMTMLLHDIGKPDACIEEKNGTRHFPGHAKISAEKAEPILKRLKFSNEFSKECVTLVEQHDTRFTGKEKQLKRFLRDFGEKNLKSVFEIRHADISAQSDLNRSSKLAEIDNAEKQLAQIKEKEHCFSLKQLEVNGNDLINAGFEPGPEIGKSLNYLLNNVIDGKVENNKDVLMDFLLKKDRGVEQGDPQITSLISSIKESNKKHFEIYVTDRENDHSKDIALSIKEGKNVVFEIAKAEYSTYLRCYVPSSDLSNHSYNAESILELSKNNNVIGRDDFAAIRYDSQTDVKDILRDVERVVEKMPDIAHPKDPKREDPPR